MCMDGASDINMYKVVLSWPLLIKQRKQGWEYVVIYEYIK